MFPICHYFLRLTPWQNYLQPNFRTYPWLVPSDVFLGIKSLSQNGEYTAKFLEMLHEFTIPSVAYATPPLREYSVFCQFNRLQVICLFCFHFSWVPTDMKCFFIVHGHFCSWDLPVSVRLKHWNIGQWDTLPNEIPFLLTLCLTPHGLILGPGYVISLAFQSITIYANYISNQNFPPELQTLTFNWQ